MGDFRRQRSALPAPRFAELRDALMASPFVARSTLGGSFQASRGFGVAFTAPGREEVQARIPVLGTFLRLAIDTPAERILLPFWRRRAALPAPNAWYLNLLLVGSGGGVAPHIDATLAAPSGLTNATPRVVSVLYLVVPRCAGGELVLARGSALVGVVRPEEGMLLHFRGDLEHQVRALEEAPPDAVRASLVLEQYHFPPEAHARLPQFRLDSRAKFELALAAASTRPPGKFELEP